MNRIENILFQTFDAVTIMFCELVGHDFQTVEDVMDVVSSMNAVFSCFDSLMDEFHVYKVIFFNTFDNNKKKKTKNIFV